jgi:hypothetical protein
MQSLAEKITVTTRLDVPLGSSAPNHTGLVVPSRLGYARPMGDGYNFQHLKTEILSRSRASDWEAAKSEWHLIGISEAEEPETCLCSHFPIIELCTIANRITHSQVDVGNVCVKRFLGFRSDLIFASIKRVRADITKSVGADATVLFHERNIINAWEYDFQQSTMSKRILTPKQMETRMVINRKILVSIKRRGIS